MVRDFYFDRLLFLSFFILMLFGIVFVFSATSIPSLLNHKDPYYFLKKEIFWFFISLFAMFSVYLVPMDTWKKLSYPIVGLSIFLLILVLIFPADIENKNVKRWLDLGIFRFQPSEFAKIAVVFFLGYFIHRKNKILKNVEATIAAFSIPVFISILIFVEPHKGAAIFILILTVLIMLSSGFDWKKVIILPIVVSPVIVLKIVSSGYASKRLEAFLDPMAHKGASSYQVFQALLAFAKGGIFGEGIGAGTQKLKYLPEIHTDYIFALIGEETGLIGCSILIALFIFILYRGIKISVEADDTFTQSIGIGFTYLIVLQGLFHMAVNVSLFPPTGFTLPFISYGGSSFLMMSICAGILLRISKEPRRSIFSGY